MILRVWHSSQAIRNLNDEVVFVLSAMFEEKGGAPLMLGSGNSGMDRRTYFEYYAVSPHPRPYCALIVGLDDLQYTDIESQ